MPVTNTTQAARRVQQICQTTVGALGDLLQDQMGPQSLNQGELTQQVLKLTAANLAQIRELHNDLTVHAKRLADSQTIY